MKHEQVTAGQIANMGFEIVTDEQGQEYPIDQLQSLVCDYIVTERNYGLRVCGIATEDNEIRSFHVQTRQQKRLEQEEAIRYNRLSAAQDEYVSEHGFLAMFDDEYPVE